MKTFNYIATSLTAIVFFIFILFVGNRLCVGHKGITPIAVTLALANDSLANDTIILANKKEVEKIVAEISNQEFQLREHYELFLKAREDDADLTKILSCVGAFVLAILAFFGINSYRELQDKLIMNAENKAQEVAKNKIEKIVRTVVEKQINEKIENKEFAMALKKNIINEINSKHLIRLESDINLLNERLSSNLQSIENDDSRLRNDIENDIDFEPMGEIPDLEKNNSK